MLKGDLKTISHYFVLNILSLFKIKFLSISFSNFINTEANQGRHKCIQVKHKIKIDQSHPHFESVS
jgi:hypothetical protein